jgi:hypothetical protein
MSDDERRGSTRKSLPIGVYLVVDGVRHPGTLRDLSADGAGFADPVLAVRLDLTAAQEVQVEIPGELEGQAAMRLPGKVAHVSAGLRPRLGIRFADLDADQARELSTRLGRTTEDAPDTSVAEPTRDLRFVLVEPSRKEEKGRAIVTTALLGVVVVAALLILLFALSRFG